MFCDPHQKHVHHLSRSNGAVPRRTTVCNLQWFHRSSCEHACVWHLDVDLETAIHICDTNEPHDSRALQHPNHKTKKTMKIFTSRKLQKGARHKFQNQTPQKERQRLFITNHQRNKTQKENQ